MRQQQQQQQLLPVPRTSVVSRGLFHIYPVFCRKLCLSTPTCHQLSSTRQEYLLLAFYAPDNGHRIQLRVSYLSGVDAASFGLCGYNDVEQTTTVELNASGLCRSSLRTARRPVVALQRLEQQAPLEVLKSVIRDMHGEADDGDEADAAAEAVVAMGFMRFSSDA